MQSAPQKRKTDKEKLFSKIREEKVTLFIGSGFSIRAGAPSARDIVEAIKDKCPQIKQTELKDVAREYTQRNNDDKENLIEILRSIFPQHAYCDDNQKAPPKGWQESKIGTMITEEQLKRFQTIEYATKKKRKKKSHSTLP